MDEEKLPLFDIAIIGGGIAGAAIARDAALRNAKVILFEKDTFGSGTSSRSSKLIHGGFRYLETAREALKDTLYQEAWKNFKFVFASLRETHLLQRLAPNLIRPKSLVVPIYKTDPYGVFSVFSAGFLYGMMSLLAGGKKWPAFYWGRRALLKKIPQLKSEGLLGGILIWDHVTHDQALVRTLMKSAQSAGAEAYEHAFVESYRWHPEKKAYELFVRSNKETRFFFSRKLVNAAGPWVDQIRERVHEEEVPRLIVPVAGSHLEFKRFLKKSVILKAKDGRIFFVINRNGISRVGTTEWIQNNPDNLETPDTDVEYLLDALGEYFPGLNLTKEDILSKDTGIRPLAKPPVETEAHQISREHVLHRTSSGVFHVLGVKLTDHRRMAKELVNLLISELRNDFPYLKKSSVAHKIPLESDKQPK